MEELDAVKGRAWEDVDVSLPVPRHTWRRQLTEKCSTERGISLRRGTLSEWQASMFLSEEP